MRKIYLTALLAFAMLAGCSENSAASVLHSTGKLDTSENTATQKPDAKVNIKVAETARMSYDNYDNGYVSLQIPKGWKVDVPNTGYASYTFKAYDPEDPRYMFLFCLKLTGFLKSEDAQQVFASLYPDSVYGKLHAIDPQTTERFFEVWNHNAKVANETQLRYSYFPNLNQFNVVENLGQLPLGGDVLRATFQNDSGDAMQGLFTASLYDPGSYIMYGYDLAPLSSYHNVMMMAPDADFNDWATIMDNCIGTITFSQAFLEGYAREEEIMVSTVQANARIYDEITDMIMDSWERRSTSYDIASQKQSDATLGYERVYDTETGDVYKAYNGFSDDYSGSRYQAVSDDMYARPISGYIEK